MMHVVEIRRLGWLVTTVLVLAVVAGVSTAVAEDEPSGTVVIEDEQLRFIVGGTWGTVTLH